MNRPKLQLVANTTVLSLFFQQKDITIEVIWEGGAKKSTDCETWCYTQPNTGTQSKENVNMLISKIWSSCIDSIPSSSIVSSWHFACTLVGQVHNVWD